MNCKQQAATGVYDPDRLRLSELRYRRLFETARGGMLILYHTTRKITAAASLLLARLYPFWDVQKVSLIIWTLSLLFTLPVS
ncbi:MAG: hypothetical protein H0T92_15665 [Pyrinomonadaceae bacterium]|nr:hypothetical protein [Pyrinomonadaceae bacterium]